MKKTRFPHRSSPGIALAAAAITVVHSAHAQTTAIWDGGATNMAWGQANNWNPNGTPTFNANLGVIFHAPGATQIASALGSSRTIGSLTFNDDADGNVTIGLRRADGGLTNANLTMGSGTIAPSITVTADSAGSHLIGDDGDSGNTASLGNFILANNLTITHNGGGTLAINRPVTGTGFGITKDGTGTLILSGANTYSGATVINEGTLQIGDGTALNGTLGNNSDTSIESDALLSINRTGTASSALQYAGTLSGNGTLQIESGARIDFTTNQTNTEDLSFVVDGTLALRSQNGVTAVSLGELSGNGNIGRGGNPNDNIDISIGGKNTDSSFTGAIIAEWSIIKVGSGNLTLAGSNNYTGNTTINAGTLTLGNNDVLPDSSPVSIANATLDAATFTDDLGMLDVTGSATIHLGSGATLAFADSNGEWTGTLAITGNFVPGNGADPGVDDNPGSLRFGSDPTGLAASQLENIAAPGWTDFALDDFGFLTATPAGGDDFLTWAASQTPPVTGGPDGDDDNDGVSNLIEYALADGAERGSLDGDILSFTKRGAPFGGDLTYIIETSTSLDTDSWSPAVTHTSADLGSPISYAFTPGPGAPKEFARLKVMLNP